MKKVTKTLIVCAILVVIIAALAIAGYTTYAYLRDKDIELTEDRYTNLAEEYDEITFDDGSGMLFVNNQVVVLAQTWAEEAEMQTLAEAYEAEIIDSDPELGIYLWQLSDGMKLKKLDKLVEELEGESIVYQAYINPVVDAGEDGKAAVYPDDEWNGDDWTLDEPTGENWGMEAIDAPGAWAYQDQLETVKIGVIDTLVTTEHEDLDIEVFYTGRNKGTNEYTTTKCTVEPSYAGYHGCHVAGIIGAKWNNNKGVSGVMGNQAQMYNSVVGSFGTGASSYLEGYYSAYDYVKAIQVLLDQGVRVINISQNTCRLVGFAASKGNQEAIDLLTAQADIASALLERMIAKNEEDGGDDFVICVAAGNSNNITYYKDKKATYGYRETQGFNIFNWGVRGGSEAKYNNFLALIDEEAVKDRIIVVGALERNTNWRGKLKENPYVYTNYSCIGERVDIVAPGSEIYSLTETGYKPASGTSMSTPHVSGVAGLAFAANPDLSGPAVKTLLMSLSTGRYYHGEHYSGMVNARMVVEHILGMETGNNKNQTGNVAGLDLCFLIDTTASMGDDIDNAKENMMEILENLSQKTPDYRVTIVDYRDFADRAGREDYPAKVQLEFSKNKDLIVETIQSLSLGDGGDKNETVYSAIYKSLQLDWRPKAKKVLIILGDAPPLDPEPVTGYTYEDALMALYHANIGIDADYSDDRVLGEPDESEITVFTISIGSSASDFFMDVAEATGGENTQIYDSAEVSDAIIESIDKIEVAANVTAKFGKKYSGETVMLYTEDREFAFAVQLDEHGKIDLDNMAPGDYRWKIERLAKGGKLSIELEKKTPKITEGSSRWYSFANVIWHRHKILLFGSVAAGVALLILILTLTKKIKAKKASRPLIQPEPQNAEQAFQVSWPVEAAPQVPEQPSVAEPVPTGRFCGYCGTKASEKDKFCSLCGQRLS